MTEDRKREKRSDCAPSRCTRVSKATLAARRLLDAAQPIRAEVLDHVVDLLLGELTREEDAPPTKPRVDQPPHRPPRARRPGRHAVRGDRAGRLIGP